MFLFGGIMRFFEFLMRGFRGLKFLASVVAFMFLGAGNAYSYSLILDDISSSYSSCYFNDNGDGTSTISAVINYKPPGVIGSPFNSRGVLIYSYDKNGRLNVGTTPAIRVTMNGANYYDLFFGSDYAMFWGNKNSWRDKSAFAASVTAVVRNQSFASWPAIAIRAGNYTSGSDIGEVKGVAYISRYGANDGSCHVIVNPGTPPPPDISISVSAPDWSLGDLQRGVSNTRLSRADQMLCFSYDAAQAQKQNFIIGASSANGVVNNRYRLQHLSDTSQVVPYSLMLDSGSTRIQLPGSSTAMTLDTSGRTCFVPTFTTEVGTMVKEGDYSDVLTFTVTTKS